MEIYLLKSTAILAILLLFYKLLLERQDMHVFNRFYLLAALGVAIAVPYISFVTTIEIPAQSVQAAVSDAAVSPAPPPAESLPYFKLLLGSIFALGTLYFGVWFLRNLLALAKRIRQNPKLKTGPVTKVLLEEDLTPHTFLNYIFLNRTQFESGNVPQEVLEHEKAHALQKHSWDILLVELLQIALWFHPMIYLLKKEIKLNHEFLADKTVLKKGINPRRYQHILLSFSSNDIHSSLVHPINYSSIKKRLTVMKTQSSKTAVWLRSLLVLPLTALLLYGFSGKEIMYTSQKTEMEAEQTTHPENLHAGIQEIATREMVEEYNKIAAYCNAQDPENLVVRVKDVNRMKAIYNQMTQEQKKSAEKFPDLTKVSPPPMPFQATQEKATKAMVEEYNKLVRHYRSQDEDYMVIRPEDFGRMKYIYNLMTPEQKKNAEEFPADLLPPPPPPPVPPAPDSVLHAPEPPAPPVEHQGLSFGFAQPVDFTAIPSAPPSPLEYMKELADEGARFFLNGEEIKLEQALNLLQNGKGVSIKVVDHEKYPATVILSSE